MSPAPMNSAHGVRGLTAIVLAGRRPGPDPLLDGHDVATKALLPIAGRPMLCHVADALLACDAIERIVVLAQDSASLRAAPAFAGLAQDAAVDWVDAESGISLSVKAVLKRLGGPLVVTTADNVLLTPAIMGEFLAGALAVSDAEPAVDVAVAMVERSVLLAQYPQSQRTWLKFRHGAWSGANLFYLGGRDCLPLLDFWSTIEQDRKKGRKIIAAFGPWLLLGAALRRLSIHGAVRRAAARFGLSARVVPISVGDACIDADKPADIVLIEDILARRA